MGEPEIKRKVELFFCQVLTAALPSRQFHPSKGGSQTANAEVINPPFTVVEVTDAEEVMSEGPTWAIEASLTYVTHIGDTESPAHSEAVRELRDAIRAIGKGFYPPLKLMVHGIDIVGTDEFSDAEAKSHGDVIALTMGCTG